VSTFADLQKFHAKHQILQKPKSDINWRWIGDFRAICLPKAVDLGGLYGIAGEATSDNLYTV
jgi:hypothetical protein